MTIHRATVLRTRHRAWALEAKWSQVAPALEVCFHHAGLNKKAFTMICAPMAQYPSLLAVVAWKNASTNLHVYSDCELGATPAKNIYTFEM